MTKFNPEAFLNASNNNTKVDRIANSLPIDKIIKNKLIYASIIQSIGDGRGVKSSLSAMMQSLSNDPPVQQSGVLFMDCYGFLY